MIQSVDRTEIPLIQDILKAQFGDLIVQDPFMHYLKYGNLEIEGIISYSLIYDRMEINYIWVKEILRRSGIGVALMRKVEFLALNEGVKNISLEVECTNIAAIGLYEKMGYQVVAKRENYYHGNDGFLMLKEMIK